MNISILIKVLEALSNLTDLTGEALALKQKLELCARDPSTAAQINYGIANAVCCDWDTLNQITAFVAACLTQNNQQNIPLALQHFQRIAVESLPTA